MIDTILYNGNIITLDPSNRCAMAVAIKFGRIVAVGSDDAILALSTASTKKQNLEGNTVIPGLTDAHLHWAWTARALQEVDVFEVPEKQIAVERIEARSKTTINGDWIIGWGWAQDFWADNQFPTANDLDTVTPHHPVFLRAKSGHAAWVNSAALNRAGVNTSTADPPGGRIGRDEHGNPTGILYETAMQLVSSLIPDPTVHQLADWMREAQNLALASGLTGFHDFDGPDCLGALQLLRECDQLHLRILKNINDTWIEHAHELGLRRGFGDDWIRLGGVKLFADGALGPRTALMIEPYENAPNNYGIGVIEKEEMIQIVSRASAAGLPATIHAIGDKAVHDVLDVYEIVRKEEAQRKEAPSTRRHRIEHVQLIHPDDIPRMKSLNIIASMQPIHATSDYQMADAYWGDRSQWAYNPRIQLDQGVVVAFGSDSPVDPFEPLNGIYAAVTRRRPDGSPNEGGWYPEAKVSIEEALRGWSSGPAYAANMEDRLGKLAPGYLADLVVLDRNILSIPHEDILKTQIIATMVDGIWRFGEL